LEPGLYFAPLGFYSVVKYKGTEHNDELPASPEKIYRGEGDVPDGMYAPIRIKFGQPLPSDPDDLKDDPYHFAMVTEVVPVVRWKITDPIIFIQTMGTEENCREILTDKTIAIFGDELSKMTPAKALLELHDISQTLENLLRAETLNCGFDIIDAYLKPFSFSKKLNEAVLEVPKAERLARATVIKAKADRVRISEEGIGKAEEEKAMLAAKAIGDAQIREALLKAEAIGLKALSEIAKTPEGQIVLWIKTLETALSKASYSIIPGSDLYSAASGLQEMLNKVKGGIK
jgi:regulator of protease activity HflC (stomatin/prohibitin superfamily)